MRILLLAQFYAPVIGGEERHVRNLRWKPHARCPKVPLRQHARGSANLRPRICRMIWLQLYRTDIARDKQPRPERNQLGFCDGKV